jgi:hypothetical protein
MARDATARDGELRELAGLSLTPSAPAPARSRLRRLIAAAGLVAVSLIAVELTCRVEDWITYGTPLFSRVTTLNDLVIRDADGMHGRPNVRYQKWRMNGLGLRGGPATPLPPPGTTRIIAVGASETFGLYESPDKEYPAQLGDSLRARGARGACRLASGGRVEVLNAAFPGMSLPTIEQDIRLRLKRFRPDVILIYPAPAGYLDELPPRAAKPDSTSLHVEFPWTRALHLRMLDRLRAQIKEALPDVVKTALRRREAEQFAASHPAGWRFDGVPTDRLASYGQDLQGVIAAGRAIGATPVLVTHANVFVGRAGVDETLLQAWQKFYPRADGPTIIAFDSASRDLTREIGAREGVLTIDAASRLAAMPVKAFGDFVHFTDLGAAGMAAVISDALCADQPPRT